MLKKYVPFAFLAAGAAGFLLRRRQMNTIFDAATGFAEKGAGVSAALTVLTFAVLAAAAVIAVTHRNGETDCFKTFELKTVSFFVYIAAVLMTFAAGAAWILKRESTVDFVYGVLSIVSAAGLGLFAVSMGRKKKIDALSAAYAVPTLLFCFVLAVTYKMNSGNPQTVEYSYQALGAAAAAMGFYYAEGYVCGRAKPKRALFASLVSVYFLGTALAVFSGIAEIFITVSALAISVVHGVCIIRSVKTEE